MGSITDEADSQMQLIIQQLFTRYCLEFRHAISSSISVLRDTHAIMWRSYCGRTGVEARSGDRAKVYKILIIFMGNLNQLLGRYINLLKLTGYVKKQQFNIQQLYVLPTLYLCVLYLSENKQRLVPLTA